MKTQILILLLAFFEAYGCETNLNIPQEEYQNKAGQVLYSGDPAVDGCGWLIKVDTVLLKPINLDSEYRVDSLNVNLDFDTLSTRWKCGWREPGYLEIKISQISKQ